MQDLLEDQCLKERNFWTQIEHPELGTSITYPKEFVRASGSDCGIRFRAPLIGEHNGEIYGGIGLDEEKLAALKHEGTI
jgi:formyl-CoA transferase